MVLAEFHLKANIQVEGGTIEFLEDTLGSLAVTGLQEEQDPNSQRLRWWAQQQ